jgi:hypothetical protein
MQGKPERWRLLERPRHRFEGNIKAGFKEIGYVWAGFIWLMIRTYH